MTHDNVERVLECNCYPLHQPGMAIEVDSFNPLICSRCKKIIFPAAERKIFGMDVKSDPSLKGNEYRIETAERKGLDARAMAKAFVDYENEHKDASTLEIMEHISAHFAPASVSVEDIENIIVKDPWCPTYNSSSHTKRIAEKIHKLISFAPVKAIKSVTVEDIAKTLHEVDNRDFSEHFTWAKALAETRKPYLKRAAAIRDMIVGKEC